MLGHRMVLHLLRMLERIVKVIGLGLMLGKTEVVANHLCRKALVTAGLYVIALKM